MILLLLLNVISEEFSHTMQQQQVLTAENRRSVCIAGRRVVRVERAAQRLHLRLRRHVPRSRSTRTTAQRLHSIATKEDIDIRRSTSRDAVALGENGAPQRDRLALPKRSKRRVPKRSPRNACGERVVIDVARAHVLRRGNVVRSFCVTHEMQKLAARKRGVQRRRAREQHVRIVHTGWRVRRAGDEVADKEKRGHGIENFNRRCGSLFFFL